jgi:hypothetical protein
MLYNSVERILDGSVFHTLHDVAVLFFENSPLSDSQRLARRPIGLSGNVRVRFMQGASVLRANACMGDFVDAGHTIRFIVSGGNEHMGRDYIFDLRDERVVRDMPDVMTPLSGDVIDFVEYVQEFYGIKIPIDLSREMRVRLMHFGESLNRRSIALEFVHLYPHWFDLTTRMIAFVMRNFPLPYRYRVFTTKILHLEEYKPPYETPYRTDTFVFDYPHVVQHLSDHCRNDVPYSYTQVGVDKTREVLRMMWCCLRDSLLEGDMRILRVNTTARGDDLEILGIFLARLLISNHKIPKICGCLTALTFRNVRLNSSIPTLGIFGCVARGFNSVFGNINNMNEKCHLSWGFNSMLELLSDDEIVGLFFD